MRGTIVAALAAAPEGLTLTALSKALLDARVPSLVDALEAEGLVERRARRIRLPG